MDQQPRSLASPAAITAQSAQIFTGQSNSSPSRPGRDPSTSRFTSTYTGQSRRHQGFFYDDANWQQEPSLYGYALYARNVFAQVYAFRTGNAPTPYLPIGAPVDPAVGPQPHNIHFRGAFVPRPSGFVPTYCYTKDDARVASRVPMPAIEPGQPEHAGRSVSEPLPQTTGTVGRTSSGGNVVQRKS